MIMKQKKTLTCVFLKSSAWLGSFKKVINYFYTVCNSFYEAMVSGGTGESSTSSECFLAGGWVHGFPEFPVSMSGHCIARLNESMYIATGGKTNDADESTQTYLVRLFLYVIIKYTKL